jgi:Flp pilus assembly protein protease CpaA
MNKWEIAVAGISLTGIILTVINLLLKKKDKRILIFGGVLTNGALLGAAILLVAGIIRGIKVSMISNWVFMGVFMGDIIRSRMSSGMIKKKGVG